MHKRPIQQRVAVTLGLLQGQLLQAQLRAKERTSYACTVRSASVLSCRERKGSKPVVCFYTPADTLGKNGTTWLYHPSKAVQPPGASQREETHTHQHTHQRRVEHSQTTGERCCKRDDRKTRTPGRCAKGPHERPARRAAPAADAGPRGSNQRRGRAARARAPPRARSGPAAPRAAAHSSRRRAPPPAGTTSGTAAGWCPSPSGCAPTQTRRRANRRCPSAGSAA